MSCAQLTTSDHGHRASASTDLEQLLVFEEGYAMPLHRPVSQGCDRPSVAGAVEPPAED